MINTTHSILIIVVMALVTLVIRALPFIIFERGGQVPKFIKYLGKVLPAAIMSFLLVYCVKSIDLFEGNHGAPELIAVACTIILHAYKRNTFLSIGVSTVLYMVLVQFVF